MRLAIIGAGAFGSWIALTAVREGFETILIERFSPAHDRSSSAGPSRIMRSAYGADEIYTAWAQQSLGLWKRFLESVHCSHLFRRTGVLWLADTSNPSIHASRRVFERRGITHEFLDASHIRARVPTMEVRERTVALFEPEAGALLAEPCVHAVGREAVAAGAQFMVGRAMWTTDGDQLRIEDTTVQADCYIFACGSWLPRIFPDVLRNVIFPTRQEVFFFDPGNVAVPSDLPIWVDQVDPRIPYGFPDIDGAGIKIAFHRPGPGFDADASDREITSDKVDEAADYLRSRFRLSAKAVCHRTDICHYENTSSGDFLIDRHPSLAKVWFAGGGSGHGFKHAPALAEYVIDGIRHGRSPEGRFRLAGMGHGLNKTVV